jgi:hypothetical protein
MPTGTLYEIIDGVRRAKACQLAGLTEISALIIVGGATHPIQISLDALRARFNMIDASSTMSAKTRWNRDCGGLSATPATVSTNSHMPDWRAESEPIDGN